MSTLPTNTNQSDRIAGVILIGGHSRRMGQDKALLKLGEATFLDFLTSQLRAFCDPIFIVGRSDQRDLNLAGCSFVTDEISDRGPLAGLMSGLKAASYHRENALVLSVDSPLFPAAVLDFLLRRIGTADAAIPWDGQRLYGLSALYRTTIADRIESMLNAGRSRIQDLSNTIEVVRISLEDLKQVDPQLLAIAGANTPEEFRKLSDIYASSLS